MRILVVTPMHNEQDNVLGIHTSLHHQSVQDIDWLVVNDGSDDSTGDRLSGITAHPIPLVVERRNDGGLIAGSAYGAWRYGIGTRLEAESEPVYTHVMKLDADVRLESDYFARVLAEMSEDVGLAGGVIATPGMREQAVHVPGPVKLYTAEAYRKLVHLPSAIGFDVMDEVALREGGLVVTIVRDARFNLARAIGASEGRVHGRYRNGRVSRWTGYHPVYFGLHVARYVLRKPYVIGAVAMVCGYVSAGAGPYSGDLKQAHGREQRQKLRAAVQDPIGWYRRTYRY